jgi:quercetin dioxygenase-like cupin family protein
LLQTLVPAAQSRFKNPLIKHHVQEKSMPAKSHENLAGQVLNPKDLIAYQDGSVVSRMIVYKKSGTITLFAFDSGEGLSEHTAPYDALALIIDGEAEISIEQTIFLLKEGQMIIMPANKPHALHAQQRFKMMLTMIHE